MTRLAACTERGYRLYLRRFQEAGCPDPEAWLDGLTPSSARNARSALLWAFPGMTLELRAPIYTSPRSLTTAQLAMVREASKTDAIRQTIDALYFTGARISELLRMEPSDIHNGMVYIRQTKGRLSERPVPLHPDFPLDLLPHPFGRDWAELWLRRTGQQVGVRLHPHLLRSTFATHLLQAGADIRTVQELLGHASIRMTARYISVTDERKREAVEMLL